MDFTILIADDNQILRESLCANIDWKALGITKVLSAPNGLIAKEIIEHERPNLVISDIVMPMMTGVELAAAVNADFPDLPFILISAHEEFEYARQAISAGVYDYILKPVDNDSLLETVRRCLEEKKNEYELRQQVKNGLEILKERFYIRSTESSFGYANFEENASYLDINFLSSYYACILFDIDSKNRTKFSMSIEDFEVTLLKMKNIIKSLLNEYEVHLFTSRSDSVEVIIGLSCEDYIGCLYSSLEEIQAVAEKQCRITVTAACGGSVDNIKSIHKSHTEALKVLEYRFMMGFGKILVFSDFTQTGGKEISDDSLIIEEKLLKLLNFGSSDNLDEFNRFLEHTLNKVSVTREYVHAFVFSLALRAYQTVCETLSQTEYEADYIATVYAQLNKFDTKHEMIEWFKNLISGSVEQISHARQDYSREIISKIKKYINENYCIEELNLEMIANEVSFSQSYISLFFKKETGTNLFDYIVNLRMEKAMKLLHSSSERISNIGSMVGYPNPSYFSNVFKKHIGVSPKEYRDTLEKIS